MLKSTLKQDNKILGFFSRLFFKETKHFFDVVIIGGGPGGYVAAIKAAQEGLKTLCIEKNNIGGTCLNVGCIPTKTLLKNSYLYNLIKKDSKSIGIKTGSVELDLKEMMKDKKRIIEELRKGISYLFKKNNVQSLVGHGKIIGPNTIEITKEEQKTEVTSKNIIIATGSVPIILPGVSIDEKTIITSNGALSLSKVPKKIIIIGGGVIGIELGCVWNNLGSSVIILEADSQIGGLGIDKEVSIELKKELKRQGIFVFTNSFFKSIEKKELCNVLFLNEEKEKTMEADIVLFSTGRKPYTEGLGLFNVGVSVDKRGKINVDKEFKTSVPSIRAIGDVIEGQMLAHKAEKDASDVIDLLCKKKIESKRIIPSIIYTTPEVAWCGKTEEELIKEGVSYSKGKFPLNANSRARIKKDFFGFVKILSDKKTNQILGCHIIGNDASEYITEIIVAMKTKTPAEFISKIIHPHPTISEALKEACLLASGKKAVHV